jgi:hypothetical protein
LRARSFAAARFAARDRPLDAGTRVPDEVDTEELGAGADCVRGAGVLTDGAALDGAVEVGGAGVAGTVVGALGVGGGEPGGASGCGTDPDGAGSGSGPAASAEGATASTSASRSAPVEILLLSRIPCTVDHPEADAFTGG